MVYPRSRHLNLLLPESEPRNVGAPMRGNTITPPQTSNATIPVTATAAGNTAVQNLQLPPAAAGRSRKPAKSSGSVKGSPDASRSSSSTPSRGRRQLPQVPHTPRPGVAYKTAYSSQVHFVSSQASQSPGRLSRGLSEHNTLRHSDSHYFPCPVPRISSEPFLGQGHSEALGSPYSSLQNQLDVFQDVASLSPTPSAEQSPRTSLPRMMGALHPTLGVDPRVPNGYHLSLGGSTSEGTGSRALRYRR
ncbi:hypothetical protein XENOCAPTIV_001834 [Xenoophorus captivus]|uniref:Uncharacterized protein n=1 Tax=Xenoophorus captivus TaxID=1517983 RepID=A0ABV0SD28_9TELE